MKRSFLLSALLLCSALGLLSQTPYIGHAVLTFNDSTRTGGYGSGGGAGRQIQCEVYYPSTSATGGDNVPIASGQYPVLVFGHGFVMAWSSYDNIWTDLVPQGYVIAFPRTEGSFSPVHADFGKDLALVATRMIGEGANTNSFLFNHLTNRSAIMGHSMGGGSSFLACKNNTNVTTMVTFAAANTNPSSIAAAANVSVPTLVIAGGNDCVAPPAANQDSMYLKTGASCKAEITIKGAGHCGFANYNTNCYFGQGTCSPQPTLSAAVQQSTASFYYSNWLAWFMKDDCSAWTAFNDSANNATLITAQKSCSVTCTTGITVSNDNNLFSIYPNPSAGDVVIRIKGKEEAEVQVLNTVGQIVLTEKVKEKQHLATAGLKPGLYLVRIVSQGIASCKTFVKN